jgi:hypothetical protein
MRNPDFNRLRSDNFNLIIARLLPLQLPKTIQFHRLRCRLEHGDEHSTSCWCNRPNGECDSRQFGPGGEETDSFGQEHGLSGVRQVEDEVQTERRRSKQM